MTKYYVKNNLLNFEYMTVQDFLKEYLKLISIQFLIFLSKVCIIL